MADTIDKYELLTINDDLNFWTSFYPNYRAMLNNKVTKNNYTLHIHGSFDPETADTPTETTAPTNEVFNYTTAVSVELISDNAGDTDKTVYVLGDHATDGFGWKTFTSDSSDGTTGVDIGDWYSILYTYTEETLAGTMKLWDGSTNDYFTYVSGTGHQTEGLIVIPSGYKGFILAGLAHLTEVPAANANGGLFEVGEWHGILDLGIPEIGPPEYKYLYDAEEEIQIKTAYSGAATDFDIQLYVILVED